MGEQDIEKFKALIVDERRSNRTIRIDNVRVKVFHQGGRIQFAKLLNVESSDFEIVFVLLLANCFDNVVIADLNRRNLHRECSEAKL